MKSKRIYIGGNGWDEKVISEKVFSQKSDVGGNTLEVFRLKQFSEYINYPCIYGQRLYIAVFSTMDGLIWCRLGYGAICNK